MEPTTIVGKRTTYVIVKQISPVNNIRRKFYLCRNGWGELRILMTCLDEHADCNGAFANYGEYLFVLRNACHQNADLANHAGHESWFPIVEETFMMPMGVAEKQVIVLRLEVEDMERLVSLGTIMGSGKSFDMPTVIWLIRELIMITDLAEKHSFWMRQLNPESILIDPEAKRVALYDFLGTESSRSLYARVGEKDYNRYRSYAHDAMMDGVFELSKNLLYLAFKREYDWSEYYFGEDYQSSDFFWLFETISGNRTAHWFRGEIKTIARKLKVDDYPFALQDEPLIKEKPKAESSSEDNKSDDGFDDEDDSEEEYSEEEDENEEESEYDEDEEDDWSSDPDNFH